ncbi:MAG TPA: PKD domain-containing protein, partial [Baekduia sp.]
MPSLRRVLATVLLSLAGLGALSATALAGPLDLDPDFGTGGITTTSGTQGSRWSALHTLADGTSLAAGAIGGDKIAVTRFTAGGARDTTFAADQPVPGVLALGGGQGTVTPTDLLVDSAGTILIAATATTASGGTDPGIVVARITAAGHLDTSFGTNGIATVALGAGGVTLGGMARQSTGAIVLAGTRPTINPSSGVLARLSAGGVLDSTFGSGGQDIISLGGASVRLDDIAVDTADRLVVTGSRSGPPSGRGQVTVARLTPDGAMDTTYGTTTPGYVAADTVGIDPAIYDVEGRRVSLSADGHATIATTVSDPHDGNHLLGLARMTPGGALDTSFGTGGTATQDLSPSHLADLVDMSPLPGGGFAVAGRITVGPAVQVAIAGYHADGSPDLTLNPGHGDTSNATNLTVGPSADDEGAAIALTPTGRLLVAGMTENAAHGQDGFVLRVGGTHATPIAKATVSWPHTVAGRSARPGQTVTFDATGSTDADGDIASYAWDLDGDGQTDHTGPTATIAYPAQRTIAALLRVTDATGLVGTAGVSVTVTDNAPPAANILQPSAGPRAGKPLVLGVEATDLDGSVADIAWDLDGNGSYETDNGTSPFASVTWNTAGPQTVGVRVTDDEGATATRSMTFPVGEAPCIENPTLKIDQAVFITQGTAQVGTGCFHAVITNQDGVRTATYTTDGHFRLNGLEVDTLGTSKAVLVYKRKGVQTTQLTLTAPKVHVEGTSKGTDFAFIDGAIAWDLKGDKLGGFKADKSAGIGGLPVTVSGEPAIDADGTTTMDVLPVAPAELLGKTPDQPIHATFGPSANAAALGAFSFKVDTIPLGVITLGPVTISYDGAGRWDIAAKASMAIPVPTTLEGKLVLINSKVKSVDLQFSGAISVGPLLITKVGLSIDFGPKVEANPNCVKHVGLEDVTPYEGWKVLDAFAPGLKASILAQDNPNQILFHQIFKQYFTPTFALCGHVALSVAKLVEAEAGFGFARYPSPLPNVFFFYGKATIIDLIHATIDAEITTEGYVHVNAEVNGGYPEADPWIGWKLGLDFEYFKQQFNAEAYAGITVVPLSFSAGARLLASNKGIVACLDLDTPFGEWHPGGGAKWGHGPTLYFMGCDVDDYKVVIKHALSGDYVIGPPVYGMGTAHSAGTATVDHVPTTGQGNDATLVRLAGEQPSAARRSAIRAHAAQAAPDPIDIPAGLPGTVMAFKGAGAPPQIILHGPKGEVIDSGAGNEPMRTPGVAAFKNATTGITEIVIAKPSGGRWTVEPAPGSSRLVEALQADATVPAKITGKVIGKTPHLKL